MIVLVVVVAVVALALLLLAGAYNRLVVLRQHVNQAFADIDVQLKQRQDLIPNLVETVKGYAAHERGTLDAVIAARNAAAMAQGVHDRAQAEGALTGAIRGVLALAEAYPDLKASANFVRLQDELADIENKLAAARRFFNNAVGDYNGTVQSFPAVLVARAMGFATREFFDVGEAQRAVLDAPPQVSF
jgi:LemA protein